MQPINLGLLAQVSAAPSSASGKSADSGNSLPVLVSGTLGALALTALVLFSVNRRGLPAQPKGWEDPFPGVNSIGRVAPV